MQVNAIGWKCGKEKTVQTFVSTCGTSSIANTMAHCDSQDCYGNVDTTEYMRPVVAELYSTAAGSVD